MLLTHVFGERIYILGSRLLIVIGVYFKPGNIDLVCITNYMHIFCMSHCVSYMYKYSFLSIHPIYQYMYSNSTFYVLIWDASGLSHV